MKLFLKILFFIFTIIIAVVGESKSSTAVNLLQKEISDSVYQKHQYTTFVFENHSINSCVNEGSVVNYSKQGVIVAVNAAKTGTNVGKNVFTVTKEGVVLPKGAKIPSNYVQNPYRSSNYGVFENEKFVEKLRIDPATPPGFKGPNQSHFHLDNGGHTFDATKWPWWY